MGMTRATQRATPRRRLVADRVARWTVTAGGLAIIASVLGILVFILVEVAPLAARAHVEPARTVELGPQAVEAWIVNEYRERGVAVRRDGTLDVIDLASGTRLAERRIETDDPRLHVPLALERVAVGNGSRCFVGATANGYVVLQAVGWSVSFDGQTRRVEAELPAALALELDPAQRPLGAFTAALGPDGQATAAAVLADGRLAVVRRDVARNPLTDSVTATTTRTETPLPVPLELLLLDDEGRNLYGGSSASAVVRFRLDGAAVGPPELARSMAPVSALTLLVGQRSLVAGHVDGRISVWSVLPTDGGERLSQLRSFDAQSSRIVGLSPSSRLRSFVAAAEDGTLGIYHSTSERVLWTGRTSGGAPAVPLYAPKGDALYLLAGTRVQELALDIPHPEVSRKALFGRVAYEGYPEPRHVWQSSGGSDESEPKLSLVPLAVGTLKGTLYSLFLAIPLGVLGAMYTSQFLHHRLRRLVKPTIEIMAALPSVVLGFLAGLWLAPRVERGMPALLLLLIALPGFALLAGAAWRALPARQRGRLPAGSELLIQIVAMSLAIAAAIALGPRLEALVFGGSFPDWLLRTTGLAYDQRNAVIVGLAMGFAVIPIIFSISEDAFSNVPPTLVSGSLALGANRWQTVLRVVLPTASPGIFSAIMIGFGRAVGETMIVLMATGNTPLLDWSPFNGFRTLAANIAVEIPEAPHGGTLYRTLFLAALLLFVFTFLANTAAELVRQRLRRRYAQL